MIEAPWTEPRAEGIDVEETEIPREQFEELFQPVYMPEINRININKLISD